MKQFKLIKKYPGSVKVDTLVYQEDEASVVYYTTDRSFSIANPQDHPKFWEVFGKTFEILKMLDGFSVTAYPQRDGKFSSVKTNFLAIGHRTYSELLRGNFYIATIKSISTGKIFKLGDKVRCGNHGKVEVIKNIRILNDIASIVTSDCINYPIDLCRLIIKPIFTTEDGVDIFKGDNYCKVTSKFSLIVTLL